VLKEPRASFVSPGRQLADDAVLGSVRDEAVFAHAETRIVEVLAQQPFDEHGILVTRGCQHSGRRLPVAGRWQDAMLDVAVEVALEQVRIEPWAYESGLSLGLPGPRGTRPAPPRFLIQLRCR